MRINSSNSLLDLQWSKTHGFFIIMGGFHLFRRGSKKPSIIKPISHEEDTPLHPLAAIDLYRNDTTLDIDFFSFNVPTEAEIKDKGKSDWLAKSLVLLQTVWFVMQCIARAIKHLPITHLEIVTLAYAAMNFVIYIFWWNKPLNVNRPVRVFRKSDPRVTDTATEPHGSGEFGTSEMQLQVREPSSERRKLTLEAIGEGLEKMLTFIVGGQDKDVELSHEDRVPRFWANNGENGEDAMIADAIVLAVGVCFGAIHCIAWIFPFSTHTELLIWRISCIAITALPVYIFLMFIFGYWLGEMTFEKSSITVLYLTLPGGILYIVARVITLVLAFTSLKELPPGAYDTVHWTTFIPHI